MGYKDNPFIDIPPISEQELSDYEPVGSNPGAVRLQTSDLPGSQDVSLGAKHEALFDQIKTDIQGDAQLNQKHERLFAELAQNVPEPEPTEGKSDPITGFKSGTVGMGEGIMQTVSGITEAGGDYVRENILPDVMKDRFSGTRPSESAQIVSDKLQGVREDINFQPTITPAELFESPASFVKNVPKTLYEYGPVSLPYLLSSMLGPLGYSANAMAVVGSIAEERALAKGESTPSAESVLESVPFGVASAALDRLGAKGILDAGLGTFAAKMLKGGGHEAGTEGVQTVIEESGSIIGTPKELDPVDMAQQAGLGAVVGGGMGAGATGVKEIIAPSPKPEEEPPPPEQSTMTQPTRDDLATAMETPEGKLPDPQPVVPDVAPEPEVIQPQSDIQVGDTIEQTVTHTGELVSGTVQGFQDTQEGRFIHTVDEAGNLNTIFDGDGQIDVISPAQPVTEDVAPLTPLTPLEPVGPPKFKDAVATMSDEQLMAAYTGNNVQHRNLADKELNARYPDRNITKNIDVAEAEKAVDTNPTDGQKEAGNYRKGLVSVNGLPISIENPKGSTRSGKDDNGETWNVTMPVSYGYFKGTKGADGDHVDVFVGEDHSAQKVYVVDQIVRETGKYDEHKVMMSFPNEISAIDAYERSFSDGRGSERVGAITTMTMDEFKKWIKSGRTKQPLSFKQQKAGPPAPEQDIPFGGILTQPDQPQAPDTKDETAPDGTQPTSDGGSNVPDGTPPATEPDLFNQPESARPENDTGKDLEPKRDGETGETRAPKTDDKEKIEPDNQDKGESIDEPSSPDGEKGQDQTKKPQETADDADKKPPESKPDQATKSRGKKLEDVGEKMEGKRAFQKDMEGKTVSEQAKLIIKSTKKKTVFNIEKREGQTDGVARYAQVFMGDVYDFSAYLKQEYIIRSSTRGRFGSKMPGWEEQIKIFFSDNPDLDAGNVAVGSWRYSQEQVKEAREKTLNAAEEYIEFGARINDILDNARNIEEFKIEIKEALEDDGFDALFSRFTKGYGTRSSIMGEYSWDKYGSIKDDTGVKTSDRATPMIRPKLDKITRDNLKDHRSGKDVSPKEFKDMFGFRGVEFGEWVSSSEGQAHVNHAYDALLDMAHRLGIKPKHISLGGKLGFAFGSRGSGKASAHYEPETNVINLTKTKGDGTVAHEWLHALDHNLRKNGGNQIMNQAARKLKLEYKTIDKMEEKVNEFLKGTVFYKGAKSDGAVGSAKRYLGYVRNNPGYHFAQTTRFKVEADKLGKDYWGSNAELLARAWEAFMLDTLDGKSPYLVSNWAGDGVVSKDTDYRGRPYPTGEERTEFNYFFNEFMMLVQFSDDGVKFKDGAELSEQKEVDKIKEEADRLEKLLPEMMKEIQDARRIQQNEIQTSLPDGNVGESTADVPPASQGEGSETADRGQGEPSTGDVSGDRIEPESEGRESGSGVDSDRDRVSRDDTVPVKDKDAVPKFQAKGENHVIAIGALDEKRSQKQKGQDNIKIIKLVKEIESENRMATPEEQVLLAKYTGWGSVKKAFKNQKGEVHDGWQEVHDGLEEVLTDKEYKEARRSMQYGHYTSEIVVRSMWKAMQRFGISSGNVFEPGMGVGNFIGMKPESLNVQYSGLEIDTMTSRIGRILYPQSSVRNSDFISAKYGDSTFDAAIGNPPFSSTIVRGDPKYRKKALSLHNFFFAKTIDMVAPGGVVSFVTSTGTMDNIDSAAREMMGEDVDLVGAIRLPNTAFKTSSHTEVVTDVIFLRKRLKGEKSNGVKWGKTKPIEFFKEDGTAYEINEYFVNNPEMVLGNITGGAFQSGVNVDPVQNSDLQQQLDEAIEMLPEKIITDIKKSEATAIDYDPPETKEGSYYINKDDALMQVHEGTGVPVLTRGKGVVGGITKKQGEKIRALIPIRDSLQKTLDAMVARDDTAMKKHQKELKKDYDKFVKKYGAITKSETTSRKPSVKTIEEARNSLRMDFQADEADFNEGSIDLSDLIGKINPETGKNYTLGQIGKIRNEKRKEIEESGGVVDEGEFNPEDVPDTVSIKYLNLEAIKTDPSFYTFMILESYNEDTGKATTKPVFERNIVAEVKKPEIKTAVDSLLYSLASKNRVDMDLMSKELGTHKDAVAEELEQLDLIYKMPNPEGGYSYVYSESYLSGKVKDKLAYAKSLTSTDKTYNRNVLALEAVQPIDIPTSRINTQLGASYFTPEVIEDYMSSELNISVNVSYSSVMNSWEVHANHKYAAENTTQYGTDKKPADEIMQSLLNKKTIQVTTLDPSDPKRKKRIVDVAKTEAAQEKGKEIQDKFTKWIWDSKHSVPVHRKFNDEFNNEIPRVYDGKHITTAISSEINLFEHQNSVVWRILQSGNTYMNHGVGAGKTLAMVTAGMEMRRSGQWKKPLYLVPNHMLAQFSGEFREAYPQAKIYVADENSFHRDRRKSFVANVAGQEWDGVVMTYSSFGKIPVSAEFEEKLLDIEITKYRMALEENERQGGTKGRGSTASKIEKKIEGLESKIKNLKAKDKDDSFTFEQLGVDALVIDEAHEFRKLSFQTNQTNLKGVTSTGAKKSWDVYTKTKYLDGIHPGRSLVMASGTPITNTLAEIYSIQRFMDERSLEERGLGTFDAWSATFTTTVTAAERQASGNYKSVTRLAKIENVGILSQHTQKFMDTVTGVSLGSLVDRPTMKSGSLIMRTVEPTEEYLAFKQYLAHRTKVIEERSGPAKKGDDIILSVINDGIISAIDMRMIDPTLPHQNSKLEETISSVFKIWQESSDDEFTISKKDKGHAKLKGGAQLIFSDSGVTGKTKNGKTFSAYAHIKRSLIKNGVPASQIAFISEYETSEEKRRLSLKVNSGEIRVLIGSTTKMGTGLNVQNRLKAIHNLDVRWLPSDIEQRIGRGLRQGNQYKEIEVYGYGTEGSYDSTMWGLLETKGKFINDFLEGNAGLDSMDDIENTDQFAIAKAMTSGDAREITKVELQGEVSKLARKASNFKDEQFKIKTGIASKEAGIEYNETDIEYLDKAIKERKLPKEGEFLMTVNGTPYTDRPEASGALEAAVQGVIDNGNATPTNGVNISELQGFPVNMFAIEKEFFTESGKRKTGWAYELFFDNPALSNEGKKWNSTTGGFSGSGSITVLNNALNRMARRKDDATEAIVRNKREIGVLKSNIADKFPQEKELETKREELAAIEKDLRENAPVEVVYDKYPIEYWQKNKEEVSTAMFSIPAENAAKGKLPKTRAEAQARLDKIHSSIQARVKRLGVEDIKIQYFFGTNDPVLPIEIDRSVDGFFDKGIIYISMTAQDPLSTVSHEVVHALKKSGAFGKDWAVLQSKAAGWRKKYGIGEEYYNEYRKSTEAGVAKNNLGWSEEKIESYVQSKLDEEGIAHAFQDQEVKGQMTRIKNKVKRIFAAIKEVISKAPFGYNLTELKALYDIAYGEDQKIFDALARGGVGKRKRKSGDEMQIPAQSKRIIASGLQSQLIRTARNLKQSKGSGDQMLAMLRKTAGVKEDEITWTGLDDFLAGKKSVTKEEITEYLEANQMQIEEVTLGKQVITEQDKNDAILNEAKEQLSRREVFDDDATAVLYEWYEYPTDDNWAYVDELLESHNVYVDDVTEVAENLAEDTTKFSSYTLPGGENYREVLMTMPYKNVGVVLDDIKLNKEHTAPNGDVYYTWEYEGKSGKHVSRSGMSEGGVKRDIANKLKPENLEQNYKSAHFDQPNILAHVRLNDRTTSDGKKVLFIEEIQSDWHQAGRKKGYKGEGLKYQAKRVEHYTAEVKNNPDLVVYETEKRSVRLMGNEKSTELIKARYKDRPSGFGHTKEDALKNTIVNLANADTKAAGFTPYKHKDKGVPDAPFKKNWHEMTFRRVMQMAAQQGYDSVAWTPGEVQNERFDLSKQIHSVRAEKIRGGTKDGQYEIQATALASQGGGSVIHDVYPENELENVVGKELAKKIVEDSVEYIDGKSYTGLDLKVGGEGMKGFYDKILKSYAGKFGKKFGAKVGVAKIKTGNAPDSEIAEYADQPDHPFTKAQRTDVWTLPITDSMREAADEGLPLFSLSKNKKEALSQAGEAIDKQLADKMSAELRPSLGKIASYALHPRQISALHKEFTSVYHGAIAMMKKRDSLVHNMTTKIELYNRLNKRAKKRVNAVLEIGRLDGKNFAPDKNGEITVTNDTFKDALHIKVGETITLNEIEAEAYQGVRESMNMSLEAQMEAVLEEGGYKEKGINNRQDLEKELRKEDDKKEAERMSKTIQTLRDIEAAKRMGYIPLKRWGEIGIVVRNREILEGEDQGELVWFERVELPRFGKKKVIGDNKAVQEAVEKLRKKFPNAEFEINPFEMKDFTSVKSNLNINDLDVLAASSDMSQDDYNNLREMIADAHKKRGFRAHFFKSDNVAGYDADFERAINDYIVSSSGYLARRIHIPKIEKEIHKIDEAGLPSLYKYARKYLDYISDPKEEFGFIRGMAFNWYLAGNIASGVTNSAQVAMVTAPWFKSMFSHRQIAKELFSAYSDVIGSIDVKKMGDHVFDLEKMPDDVRSAVLDADADGDFLPKSTLEAGQIAHSSVHELRGMGREIQKGLDLISLTFAIPERINRLVTYTAAFRFAIKPENKKAIMAFAGRDQNARYTLAGKSGQEFAEAFATFAVHSTQFHMGKMNRPILARGIGTLPTQFLSFTAQALELQYRLAKVHGADSGKALGLMLLTVVAMSGIKGFPFADDLEEMFEKAWQVLTRTDIDIDTEMKLLLDEYVGEKISEIIRNGIPAGVFGIDMSGRWGFGNITPDNQSDMLGVNYNMLIERPIQAITNIARGDPAQALADVSPAIIKNSLQSYLWAKKGIRSGKSGDTVIIPEDLTKADIGLKFFGFTSSKITSERDKIYASQRAGRAVSNLRSDYYDKLAREMATVNRLWDKDREKAEAHSARIEAIWAEIHRHNEKAPLYKQIVIHPTSLKKRIQEELLGAKANKGRKQSRLRTMEIMGDN